MLFSIDNLFNPLSVTGPYCLCPMLCFPYNEIIVLFSELAPLCLCVCTCICVCLAGSTRLGQTSLVPSRWMTWLGGVLACSQWPVWFHYWEVRDTHTHTWASYCAVSLICHVEGVTQTCMTHKHKQAVSNANMPHFTHGHIQMHSHTHTHMHAYEVPVNCQQAFHTFTT